MLQPYLRYNLQPDPLSTVHVIGSYVSYSIRAVGRGAAALRLILLVETLLSPISLFTNTGFCD